MSYFKVNKIDAIKSTNDFLKELYLKKKISDRFLLIANDQFKGRGQRNSTWLSEAGKNITLSIYKEFKEMEVTNPFIINCLVSIAILDTLKEFNLPNLSIKWPNEILSGDKKLCGILIENFFRKDIVNASIIGIGLNVNQINFQNLPKASSMYLKTGNYIEINDVFNKLIFYLEKYLKKIKELKFDKIIVVYESNLYRKNIASTFIHNEKYFTGYIKGISNTGKLKVKNKVDGLREFNFKEIKLIN